MSAPYQVLPPLADDEYHALKTSIAEHGVLVPVEYDQDGNILDGHHRLRACDELGIKDWPSVTRLFKSDDDRRRHARVVNLARRHLNRAQKRQLIADEIQSDPDRSDRAIGRLLGVDHKTVGSVRRELNGGIPHPEPVPTEREIGLRFAEMLHEVGASDELCAIVKHWATSETPCMYYFAALAWHVLVHNTDGVLAWPLLSLLRCLAENTLQECEDVRRRRGVSDWRGPGERLAEIIVIILNPDVSDDTRTLVRRVLASTFRAGCL